MISVFAAATECLSDGNLFAGLYETVHPRRKEKIDKMRLDKDRRLSLGAGLLLKKALLNFGEDYDNAVFAEDSNGKPYILGGKLFFNLSHSENRVMCAVSDKPVGCDVEKLGKYNDAIAKRFFHKNEYAYILSLGNEEEKRDAFYRIWTQKESFVKAIGLGIRLPFDSFSALVEFGLPVEQSAVNEDYFIRSFDVLDKYKCSVCSVYKNIPDIKEISLL